MRSWSWFCVRVVLAGVASAGAVLVCGCHKTVMVFGPSALPDALAPNATDMQREKAAAKELPGIPFYNHYGICTQETVWLEPQTTLTLTVTPEKEKPVIQTMTLNNRAFHDTYVDPNLDPSILVKQLEALKGDHQIVDSDSPYCPSRVAGNWQAIKDKYKVVAIDDTTDIYNAKKALYLVPVTNTADIGTAVDYSRVYYLNARSPLNGTSTVDAKLNVDGTLGEGSATTDNETLSAVLTTLGTLGSGALTAWSTIDAASITGNATVNAAAAAALAPAGAMKVQSIDGKPPKQYVCAEGGGWPGLLKGAKVTFDFSVATGGFTHDHKLVTPLDELTKVGRKCDATQLVYGGSFTVTPVAGGDKPDKTAYTVSGTITPPKPPKDAAKQ